MLNSVTLVGNLGQEVEVRYTGSGTAVANLSIATNSFYKGEQQTEWHRVVVFGKTAETCGQYLTKGRQVLIQGSLRTRGWEDRNQVKRFTTEVVANRVLFLGSKPIAQAQESVDAEQMSESELSQQAAELFGIG